MKKILFFALLFLFNINSVLAWQYSNDKLQGDCVYESSNEKLILTLIQEGTESNLHNSKFNLKYFNKGNENSPIIDVKWDEYDITDWNHVGWYFENTNWSEDTDSKTYNILEVLHDKHLKAHEENNYEMLCPNEIYKTNQNGVYFYACGINNGGIDTCDYIKTKIPSGVEYTTLNFKKMDNIEEDVTDGQYENVIPDNNDHKVNVDNDLDFEADDNPCETYLGDGSKGTPMYYLDFLFNLIKYVAIVLLFVLTVVEYAKAVTADKDDAIKKATTMTVKRLILAIVIFFLPILIEFIFVVLFLTVSESLKILIRRKIWQRQKRSMFTYLAKVTLT